MSGQDFQEEAMLAAVRHLKAVQSSADYTGPFEQSDTSAVSEEPTSLEVLFREHHDRVFRTAHRVTGSAADAEDVLQTVFLRVARGQESIGFAENPQAYFARAAIMLHWIYCVVANGQRQSRSIRSKIRLARSLQNRILKRVTKIANYEN